MRHRWATTPLRRVASAFCAVQSHTSVGNAGSGPSTNIRVTDCCTTILLTHGSTQQVFKQLRAATFDTSEDCRDLMAGRLCGVAVRAAPAALTPNARPCSGLQRPGPAAARAVLPPAVHPRRRGSPTEHRQHARVMAKTQQHYQGTHTAHLVMIAFKDQCQRTVHRICQLQAACSCWRPSCGARRPTPGGSRPTSSCCTTPGWRPGSSPSTGPPCSSCPSQVRGGNADHRTPCCVLSIWRQQAAMWLQTGTIDIALA